MPFWSFLVRTGPEVDDDELPLAKHRLIDDDGRIKPASRLSLDIDSIIERVNAKKVAKLSPKERAALIKKHTGIVIEYHNSTEDEDYAPARSPARKSAGQERDASPSPQNFSSAATSPSKSPSRQTAASKSQNRASSASPVKSPSKPPAKSKSPAVSPSKAKNGKKSAPESPKSLNKKRQRSSSVAKSTGSRSRSRSASAAATPVVRSGKPSPRWTVAELRAYASANSIDLTNGQTKADMLEAIENSH